MFNMPEVQREDYDDRIVSCEPNYKEEYFKLQEKCKELIYENDGLAKALINLAVKLSK